MEKEQIYTARDYFADTKAQKDLDEARQKIIEQMENSGNQIVEKALLNDKKEKLKKVDFKCGLLKNEIRNCKLKKIYRIYKSFGSACWYFLGGFQTFNAIDLFKNGDIKEAGFALAAGITGLIAGGIFHGLNNRDYAENSEQDDEKQKNAQKILNEKTQEKEMLQKEIAYLEANTKELP